MMMRMRARPLAWVSGILLSIALACCVFESRAQAQAAPQTVKVGVYVSPPFVMKDADTYSGMAIDLWEATADKLRVTTEYQEFKNYADLIRSVASGSLDAAVTNLSITAERATVIDFTHPWFDAGLRVMIPADDGTSFWEVFYGLGDAGHLQTYVWIVLMVLATTAALTLFDRKFDADFPKRWRDGIAESFYHVMSITTSGKSTRKNLFGWTGRIWQGLWMVCGVAVIAYITSSITSVMTVANVTNQISSVADLQGKIVGVRAGGVAEEYMRSVNVTTLPYNHMADAIDALLNGEISAIVGDAPVLEYFAHSNPKLALNVVGNTFRPDKYGFAFSIGSPLTKPASVAIIATQESGQTEILRKKYFGFSP